MRYLQTIERKAECKGKINAQDAHRKETMPETVSPTKQPWEMNKDEFQEYVLGGKLYQQTGIKLAGEDKAETWLRLGLINGYPEKNIAYFYSLSFKRP
jgi:hypothetical protein